MAKILNKIQPVILIVLDGWGVSPPGPGNAISLAKTPNFDRFIRTYPTMTLQASGEAVGLPWGEPGNSEVGHLNLGAGKIVWQSLPCINRAIGDGSFFENQFFLKAIREAKEKNSNLHLVGLISDGCVHSSNKHLYALLELAAKSGLKKVFIHAILDGRDTPRDKGLVFMSELLEKIADIGVGKVATIAGRFWSMDRDNHWERIESSYKAMVSGESEKKFSDPLEAIKSSYEANIYDEEFEPVVITEERPLIISQGDSVIFFNFRPDRARELTKAFVLDDFNGFQRQKIKDLYFVTMVRYERDLPVEVAFSLPEEITNPLARVLAERGVRQFHIAETEKYAHVTFFFNGGREKPYPGEERMLIPSPRLASYDQKPEMSAPEVAHQVLWALDGDKYKFILVNFANPDMLGHTGNVQAAVQAVEAVDGLLGKIVGFALEKGWVSIITADHGDCEQMINPVTGEIDKEHTTNPVPFIIVDSHRLLKPALPDAPDLVRMVPVGVLGDVTPTILKIMGIEKPEETTGTALV